jgi:hypothetical protein
MKDRSSPVERRAATIEPSRESLEHLVDRVASAAAFRKSNRLRELLQFLCARALSDPGATTREQEIGVRMFGREAGYDTGQDAIVRVQASLLRKKLQEYFASDGQDEPIVIELPKGTYTPVFRSRESESNEVAQKSRGRRSWLRSHALLLTLLAAGALVAAWLVLKPSHFGGPASLGAQWGPAVDRLWSQMFANGQPTSIVISDLSLTLFQDRIQRQLSLNEYRNKEFNRLADDLLTDPAERTRWKDLMRQAASHTTDARLAALFSVFNATHNVTTEVVSARDFGVATLHSHNLILLGTLRANPWVELFENQLNFRTAFREAPMMSWFQNESPAPGESTLYSAVWQKRGYCRVAFLPNQRGSGNVLLVSGTEMASTEAGGQFISSERRIQALRSALKLTRRARFPYFEVLLKVDYVTSDNPTFEIVAHRVVKP